MIRASNNPESAFLAAYEEHADAIFRHCAFRLFNRERAKELMQDTFCKAWEYIAKGNDIDNVKAFLYRTADNLIVDEVRRRERRPETSLEDLMESGWEPPADDTQSPQDATELSRIRDALTQVEEPYRSALVMRYVDGLSPAEIAEMTGESPNTISVRLHRGLKSLRSRVDA
ncbi:MAG: RNA polymerase sigma-70 factor, ECF subfamily [Candidatus Peregrinibacteria bacterium Gr01-1014_25]|nr:MAG: RNA polymerase sigma-70 factor, ECF subfamily [Candidatus Peregrinibacteria bacterium Gr01-1014_25]